MKKNKANLVEFVDSSQKVHPEFYPVPAQKEIPEWYRATPSYIGNQKYVTLAEQEKHKTNATVKKCLPFFDSMTAGYIIKLHVDVIIRWDGKESTYQWASENPIGFQGTSQAQNYPGQENRSYAYPKFNNPWSIRTPKGYSCLITTPMHRDLPFETLDGIVDTDSFFAPILFPFYLKEEKWEGIIEAGTPIAQVIPFKRESWKFNISEDPKKINESFSTRTRIFASFVDGYRKAFWNRKEWK